MRVAKFSRLLSTTNSCTISSSSVLPPCLFLPNNDDTVSACSDLEFIIYFFIRLWRTGGQGCQINMDGKQVVVSYLVQLSSCVICCQLIKVRHSNGMYTLDRRDMDCQVQCKVEMNAEALLRDIEPFFLPDHHPAKIN